MTDEEIKRVFEVMEYLSTKSDKLGDFTVTYTQEELTQKYPRALEIYRKFREYRGKTDADENDVHQAPLLSSWIETLQILETANSFESIDSALKNLMTSFLDIWCFYYKETQSISEFQLEEMRARALHRMNINYMPAIEKVAKEYSK